MRPKGTRVHVPFFPCGQRVEAADERETTDDARLIAICESRVVQRRVASERAGRYKNEGSVGHVLGSPML